MKKYIYIALTSILLIVACGGNPKTQPTRNDNKETVEQKNTDSIRVSPSPNKQYSRTTTKEKMDSGNFFYFIVLLLAILGEGYLIYQLWKAGKENTKKINYMYGKLKSIGIGTVKSDANLDNEKILRLLKEIKLELKQDKGIVSNEANKENKTMKIEKIENNIATSERYLVYRANNVFKETENRDDAICYVFTDTNEFKFFEDKLHASKVMANREDYRDFVDFEGDAGRASNISMIKCGKCKPAEGKKWIVTEKAKIKFV